MLQNNTCFCIDSSPGNQASLPCNLKCPGNEAEDCGGADVISVYRKGTNCRKCLLFFQIPHIRSKFFKNNLYAIQSLFTSPLHGVNLNRNSRNSNRTNVYREKKLYYWYLIHKKIRNCRERIQFFEVPFCFNNYTKYCCILTV